MSGTAGEAEVIIILGIRGYGKSTWLDKYLSPKPRRFCFDPFRKFPAQYLTADQLIEGHERNIFKPENSPRLSIGSHFIPDVDLLASVAFLNGYGYLVLEECGVTFNKGERLSEPLQEAVFLGRHNALSLVLVAQRAASIPIELRSQATRLVSFNQREKNDVKWLEDYFAERTEEIRSLDKLECLDYENNSVTRYRISPHFQ